MCIRDRCFLLLNETMIRAVEPSHWLLYWAVVPVVAHVILSALILTVINTEDDGQALR